MPSPSSHPRDPLHGITLENIINQLVERHGWAEMGERIPVRCFQFDPSVKSSLTFLRKTPWARQLVEEWFIEESRKKCTPNLQGEIPMTEQLENISLKLKANVYFDGGVISHSVTMKDGNTKTVGIIRKGEYHFNTDAPEQMDILAGSCRVKLAGEKDWTAVQGGQSFKVGAQSSFDIAVDSGLAEYLCTFLHE